MENQKLPEGVELFYTDRAVHLTTNEALMTYLRQKGNGSLPLSRTILDGYAEERGMQLQITERSMATELLIHAYLDGLFDRWASKREAVQDGKTPEKCDCCDRYGGAQRRYKPMGLRSACSRLQNALRAFGQQGVRSLYERIDGKTISDAAKASGR